MIELLTILLKVSLAIFIAANLLDMGLRLDPGDALRGLRNVRFVAHTLVWGFALGPALAYAIALLMPFDPHYATGLILMGMTPCAPFLPMIVNKAKGDLGYTAAIMLLTAVGTVVVMPIAVPLMVKGLTVGTWAIARPLLLVVLLPLAAGMATRRQSPAFASTLQPFVKKTTGVTAIATCVLIAIVYGRDFLDVAGSLALVAQLIFFSVVTVLPYGLGFGLQHEQKFVLSAGMATRNLGAAVAPLFAIAEMDERAIVMLVLALPMMVGFAFLAARWFGRPGPT